MTEKIPVLALDSGSGSDSGLDLGPGLTGIDLPVANLDWIGLGLNYLGLVLDLHSLRKQSLDLKKIGLDLVTHWAGPSDCFDLGPDSPAPTGSRSVTGIGPDYYRAVETLLGMTLGRHSPQRGNPDCCQWPALARSLGVSWFSVNPRPFLPPF